MRKPLTIRARSRRALDEHVLVRLPGLYVVFARALSHLQPRSRVRQALVWRNVGLSLAATNRRDFEAVFPRYDPEVEFVPAEELVQLGIAASYRGHDGFLRLWDDWDSEWAGHAQWEPRELIDLGDRLLILAGMRGTGERSGIDIDMRFALLVTLRNGRAIREEHYFDPATALEAVGLPVSTPRCVVRQPLVLREHTRRRLEERLALRFPDVLAPLARSVLRLPPSSWLRRAVVRRAAQLAFEALNRDDVDAAVVLYHPDVELDIPKEFVGLGLDPPERGREERANFERKWNAEWGGLRYEFGEIIDLGDNRMLLIGRFKASGPSSGAGFDNEFAEIFTLSAGQIIREQAFFSHAEALDAAGLPAAALA